LLSTTRQADGRFEALLARVSCVAWKGRALGLGDTAKKRGIETKRNVLSLKQAGRVK
jgi:hypothetical protein